jgi:transposase InsO family protein
VVTDENKRLTKAIRVVKTRWPRYGYRRVTAELRAEGWRVNAKRVARLCRDEGLKVLRVKRKRQYLGSAAGGIERLSATRPNHVWAIDFVHDRTADGRDLKILAVVDEYTRECLALEGGRSIRSADVIEVLRELCLIRGVPAHVRSDNGPEFIADRIRGWLSSLGSSSSFIEPGSPWQNAYVESFNSRLRDELLSGELFPSLAEAKYLLDRHRLDYNHRRRHSALDYQTPAEYAASCGAGMLEELAVPS